MKCGRLPNAYPFCLPSKFTGTLWGIYINQAEVQGIMSCCASVLDLGERGVGNYVLFFLGILYSFIQIGTYSWNQNVF